MFALIVVGLMMSPDAVAAAEESSPSVSFANDIQPIFAAHCYGCHQPAKPSGNYSMTSFDRLIAIGDRGEQPVVAGKPHDSLLVSLITPTDGQAEMPADGEPLSAAEIELITRWIAAGAMDDTPAASEPPIDQAHPPVYTQPPVVTSIDYSPDGQLLAIAGYHEVRLHRAEGFELVGRLVGLSERIETVRFSPDGKRLAVAGGNPAQRGEIQIWDVMDQELLLSHMVSYDTLRGVSWSPDGKQVAFGATDNTIRAIDSESGEQLLFQGAPNDWPLDTVYSVDGSHLVAVGRDMTAKLVEVPNERFVDNITSITPGALKGGIHSVARHPERDEILFGGADGVPRIYRMHRQTKRVIGDDANLLLEFSPLPGRIFSIDISPEGSLVAAASSLNGQGALHLYRIDPAQAPSEEIKQLLFKPTHSRSADENQKLKTYFTESVTVVAELTIENSPLYSVAISPDGTRVVAAGRDGVVRMVDGATGELLHQFDVVELQSSPADEQAEAELASTSNTDTPSTSTAANEPVVPDDSPIARVVVEPTQVDAASLTHPVQLTVTAELEDGRRYDVTRQVAFQLDTTVAQVDGYGELLPIAAGSTRLQVSFHNMSTEVPVEIRASENASIDYIRDVNPILTRAGCNAGTCHGAKDGKNGFKLSLRGYDSLYDIRSLTDDHASRRVNLASPGESLMLLKAIGVVPHEGGQVIEPGSRYYHTLREWIESGAGLNTNTPRVIGVRISPTNPVVEQIGERQQFRVIAEYADGATRDVTADAFIESGNADVAEPAGDHAGLIVTLRRGEAPVLVRYEGAYAATTLTIMGDRTGFEWAEQPATNDIDRLVDEKLKRTKTLPSPVADDYAFVRRVYLDLTGLPPTTDQIAQFVDNTRDSQTKRDALVDQLVGSPSYVEHWSNKWADLLQVNGKFLGREGATAFRQWIRDEISGNTPYDEFVAKIITASGSNRENPAASYYKILRTPEDTMENTTHLFLSTRFNCNKCHDHPFERWTQDEYYEMAAYFSQVTRERDPESGDRTIGGTAVEGNKPLFEVVADASQGEMVHERTGQVTPPSFPYEVSYESPNNATRRQELAAWITSPDNPYFARSYANRLWGYLLGTGIIEPIDDIRAGNPPSNPELLDYLTNEFVSSDFDTQHLVKLICKSDTYQRSVASNDWNVDDTLNFSHARPRRLPAEVLYDAVHQVTGTAMHLPGVPAGTRAAALPDSGIKLADGFLDNLGRPARESACECERVNEMQLGPVMAFVTGPTIGNAISNGENTIAHLAAADTSDAVLIEEIYLRILNRPPISDETTAAQAIFDEIRQDHDHLVENRDRYVVELTQQLAQRELARQQQVIHLSAELASHRVSIAAERKRMEQQRNQAIAAAEQNLKQYTEALATTSAEWEAELRGQFTPWHAFTPLQLNTTIPGELIPQDDGSILAKVEPAKGAFTISGTSVPERVTAILLEALPDANHPESGPGLAHNGNFVLTEFSAQVFDASSEAAATAGEPLTFDSAKADYSQENYSVASAIDGNLSDRNNGWAISGQAGQRHVAVFRFATPVLLEENQQLQLQLQHLYTDSKHQLGRFRLSTTDAEGEADFGLPPEVDAILQVAAAERSDEQKKSLADYRQANDSRLKELQQQLATAQQPLAMDAREQELQSQLQKASQPLPIDEQLRRMEQELLLSKQQLNNLRLTAAQDLAWALLNSPAFLYNH
ncbi:DUF1549 domain-containing protein [Aeoliella mucimassa]|uniref:DUF1549 domain-containing protein n=1 Tax=Aeoliella mucimassa TaxID=2527972 RepID=UPI001E4F6BF3|nr:DUF1549 domain-containing protein [Aeoliella mucimassa]